MKEINKEWVIKELRNSIQNDKTMIDCCKSKEGLKQPSDTRIKRFELAVFIIENAIVPQYKIGDEVWCVVRSYLRNTFIGKGKICARKYFDNDIGEKWFEYMISRNKEDCDPYEVQEKYVFLTQAEAKAALDRLNAKS